MDRTDWLTERRIAVEQDYTYDAPTYDDGYDPATAIHRSFVSALLDRLPPGGAILDAACGTAPYAGMVLDLGFRYFGIDQSRGMLERARTKWPRSRFEQVGLQEMRFEDAFDGVMCTDAMENVPPEHWPVVLEAFSRALRNIGGHVYLTIEEIDRLQIDEAFTNGTRLGWPIVLGEVIEGDTAGYHYYPERAQVGVWLADAGFEIVREDDEPLDGYAYRHLLLRTAEA